MSTTLRPSPRDRWLLATLNELLPRSTIEGLEAGMGNSYWEAAVGEKLVTEDELLEHLSARTRIRIAGDLLVSSAAREAVPERLARRFGILPLSVSATVLDIATANPYDLDCEQTLAFATSRGVRMLLASPVRIAERIEEVYAPVKRVSRMLNKSARPSVQPVLEKVDDPDGSIDETEAERPIIKLVDHIVAEGIASSASDIHLEAGEHGISVRYRIDGMLREVMMLPQAVGIPLVSRIKIMSQMVLAQASGGYGPLFLGQTLVQKW